jgi:hypothetical protein
MVRSTMAHPLSALQRATRRTVLDGPGDVDLVVRQQIARGEAPAELAALVRKVRDHAYRVTEADLEALRPRYSEDQLFEIIVAAALGAAEHRLERALSAVEGA